MGEILVADSETDGFLEVVSKLHMLQLGTLHGSDVTIYLSEEALQDTDMIEEARRQGLKCPLRPLVEGIQRLRAADMSYWHNGIRYDRHICDKFMGPGVWTREKTRDTLVMARLAWSKERKHSLEAWGIRMGILKGEFKGPWDRVTPEMLVYSEQDVVVGRALALKALKELEGSWAAMAVEHAVAYWIDKQEHNGFHLNVKEAERLYVDLLATKRELERKLAEMFPPRWVATGPSRVSKANNKRYGYTKGWEFTPVEYQQLEPGSHDMLAQRFVEKGWKPTKRTPSGGIQMDEEVVSNLALRYPEAVVVAEYFDIAKQAGAIGGKGGWLALVKPDGRVHGSVNPIGAYTQRMSHAKPNMTTVPKSGPYRGLWGPRKGWKLVGIDGEGIQARVVGHYLHHWDQGAFGDRCVNGNSDLGTDIHAANRDAIGHLYPKVMMPEGWAPGVVTPAPKHDPLGSGRTRGPSKNILYAIFFGAQDPRLGITLKEGCLKAKVQPPRLPNRELGGAIRRGLEKTMTGLSKLQELVEKTFEKRKSINGLDGRKLRPPSKRNCFVTLIQAGEAVIMKTALVIFCDEFMPADGLEWDRDWALCANVHDEVQIECRPEIAEHIGARMAEAIKLAGQRLGMKCEQQGKATIGNTWAETH